MKNAPIYVLLLVVVFYTSCKGQRKTDLPKDTIKSQTKITARVLSNVTSFTIDTIKGVVIQNSLPKGGPYTHPTGERFGRGIFWTRVINETDTPLELTINFPADSFPYPASNGYYRLFLPPDTMTLAKESLFDYGATGLLSFFDAGLHKSTRLQKTINPKEEHLFYIALLMGGAPNNGPARTELVLKDNVLFYKVSIGGLIESALIPCGHIISKK